jgi:phosphoenolpyruvate synthase/pyruvate phosphate dikinase
LPASAASWSGTISEVQDVEFTIERGKLWMLQTRDAKRTAQAAVRIAVDLANEQLSTARSRAAREARARRLLPAPAVRPERQEGGPRTRADGWRAG